MDQHPRADNGGPWACAGCKVAIEGAGGNASKQSRLAPRKEDVVDVGSP